MNLKEKKKPIILGIITVVTLLVFVVGISFAFFIGQKGNGAFSNILVGTSSTDSLTFAKGNDINIAATQQNFTQNAGNLEGTATASAKLIANNDTKTATRYYSVSLDIMKNEYEYTNGSIPELMLVVNDENGVPVTKINGLNYTTSGGITGFDITTRQENVIITDNKEINTTNYTTGSTENWTIKVYFINLNSNQYKNAGKMFTASINIYSGDKKMLTNETGTIALENANGGYLKNFKIHGNSVQNGVPSPTSPVAINSFGTNNINIETKGNNILENSNFANTNTAVWSPNQNVEVKQGIDYYQVIYKQTTSSPGLIWLNAPHIFEIGKTYTVSARVKGINNSSLGLYFFQDVGYKNISTSEFKDISFNFVFKNYLQEFILLYNTSTVIDSGFQIKWLKIEEGSLSTLYNEPKNTIINMANHEPLMKVGDVTDYIDFDNNRIVRNIGKKEFVGTEGWTNYVPYNGRLKTTFSLQVEISNVKIDFGIPYLTTHLPFVQSIWNSSINNEGVGKSNNNVIYLKVNRDLLNVTLPSNYETQEFDTSNVVVNAWKEWLKNQKSANKSFVVYFQLDKPIYEQIELPKMKTFDGNNRITVSDGTMNPSKIDVTYFS